MKKGLLITILVCIGFIIAGAIIFGIGIKNGGGLIFSIDYKNHKLITPDNAELIKGEQELDEFDKLDITVSAADVHITEGDSYHIKYSFYDSETPTINVEDKTLKITTKVEKENNHLSFNLFSDSETGPKVEITVPKGTKLDVSKIKTNAGDVTFKDITMASLDFEADAGDINLDNTTVDTVKITTDAGDLDIKKSTIDSFELDVDAGDIDIDNTTIKNLKAKMSAGDMETKGATIDNIDISVDYGDVDLGLTGEEADYNYEIKIAYGDFEINDKDMSNIYNSKSGKDKTIKINSASGDIDIDF